VELLANRPFRRILAAEAISELGTWLAYVALAVVVYDRTHSPAWVSALLLVDAAPVLVAGALLAPLIDRCRRRELVVVGELVGAAAFAPLALGPGLPGLLGLAFLAGCASAVTKPALNAALPNAVRDEELAAANALLQTVGAAGVLLGPVAAGALVAVGGGRAAFAANAASFLFSALLLARVPAASLQREDERAAAAHEPHLRALREGAAAFSARPLRGVLVGWSLASVVWGALNVSEVLVAKRVFATGDTGFGVLAAAAGAGMLAGSVLVPRLAGRIGALGLYVASLAFTGVALAGLAAAPIFAVAVACWGIGAIGNVAAITAQRLVVQRETADGMRGRVFGLLGTAGFVAMVAGLAAASPVVATVGVRGLVAAGAAVVLAAALAGALAGGLLARRPLVQGLVTDVA
jgi:MFS family permease